MAAKLLLSQFQLGGISPSSQPRCFHYLSNSKEIRRDHQLPQSDHRPNSLLFVAGRKKSRRRTKDNNNWKSRASSPAVCCSLVDSLSSGTDIMYQPLSDSFSSSFFLLAADSGYSLASYYTSLGLFVISVPGLWSLIKRSVKSKIVKKTYVLGQGKLPNQVAGQILSFFTRNNFAVVDRGETITFEGTIVPNRGQAALLTFCTCISLASVALVLTITAPDVGNKWFLITSLSPLAGLYYWRKASRKEQIQVKMIVNDNGVPSEIIVQGDDVQVEEMRKELELNEKGMVYVKGVFER
ncbi:protein COFACTOR ASSEMBLY OF COMPLEX C SUBUNIT B CCB1, chloroplastic [Impatiens glandulifera]|uniref:protein COFACTOR ASSEMBLY OF COMPLEX C SUBUNIT B CCB1, chloroplastic n=1 Tax=Impatiens glandulifera TaxID=253017 RepID=UPI001FB07E37|nr:protein COFACTOR ASSEMBLY OF COMPLEX C SUBUNIT B CCB1, chloroplastic [Impatiens glandulifera]